MQRQRWIASVYSRPEENREDSEQSIQYLYPGVIGAERLIGAGERPRRNRLDGQSVQAIDLCEVENSIEDKRTEAGENDFGGHGDLSAERREASPADPGGCALVFICTGNFPRISQGCGTGIVGELERGGLSSRMIHRFHMKPRLS